MSKHQQLPFNEFLGEEEAASFISLIARFLDSLRPWGSHSHDGKLVMTGDSTSRTLQPSGGLGQKFMDDLTGDIGQTEITTIVIVGETLMVDAEQVKDGSVQVVEMDPIDGRFVADLIRLAVADATFHAAAG